MANETSNVSMIVLTGGEKDDPSGTVRVEFVSKGWAGSWSKKCSSLEEAFKAIRLELAPRPDNVVELAR